METNVLKTPDGALLAAFTAAWQPDIVRAARRCATRLLAVLPHEALNENKVFVAYGGGKDSSYMLAFVRLVQLLVRAEHQKTFRLVVATNRHSGMPTSVMQNIDSVYRAIAAYEDADVEVFLVEGDRLIDFCPDVSPDATIIAHNRLDILMTGHRCEAEGRPTFCNACNLSMIKSFAVMASYNGGVDVVITGDSLKEQRAYVAWTRQIARKFGVPRYREDRSFNAFLQTMGSIAQHYFQDIYGAAGSSELQARQFPVINDLRQPVFFSIYADTAYEAGAHWDFLTGFLGFQFDDLAFSFTESDCANPALMAHLRGLKTEHMYGRTYSEGIAEYVQFALGLMQKKHFPPYLIEQMRTRYDSPESIQTMRRKLERYAYEVLDLTEEQLICMLYSPFVEEGKNLSVYLEREQPHLCGQRRAIHLLLSSAGDLEAEESQQQRELAHCLSSLSHLDIACLRSLYRMKYVHNRADELRTPISIILERDPHKGTIQTAYRPGGPLVTEVISGR